MLHHDSWKAPEGCGKLLERYKWKEQLTEDVGFIRAEVRQKGGIGSRDIEKAIKKYRKNIDKSDA